MRFPIAIPITSYDVELHVALQATNHGANRSNWSTCRATSREVPHSTSVRIRGFASTGSLRRLTSTGASSPAFVIAVKKPEVCC